MTAGGTGAASHGGRQASRLLARRLEQQNRSLEHACGQGVSAKRGQAGAAHVGQLDGICSRPACTCAHQSSRP